MKITKGNKHTKVNSTKSNLDKYSDARKYINAAIQSIASKCDNDIVGKESIANLSVILFDLQS